MNLLKSLIDSLRCLPGVGPKSAQRMSYYLLQHKRQHGLHLANILKQAMNNIQNCHRCNNFTEDQCCDICQNSNRDQSLLCIVENPIDLIAIEQTNFYNGIYFVLMGKISPLDGLGPNDLQLPKLKQLIAQEPINEVIIALSPTIEGQTTVHFIRELLGDFTNLFISQLAHGIPSGCELEFLDSNTIGCALRNRAIINNLATS